MNKAQKIVIIFLVISLILIGGLYSYYKYQSKNSVNIKNNTLFYSLTCPHCKNVEEFMNENNITQKINLTQLEVSQNQYNAQLLIDTGKLCKIDSQYLGSIPLLYSNGQCYLGDTPIIEYLNKTTLNL